MEKIILEIVITSYFTLRTQNLVTSNWDEERVTLALYEEVVISWGSQIENTQRFIPVHQFPVYPKKIRAGKPPSIDFVFSKGYETQTYFAFECKKVISSNSSHCCNYVKLGMNRYINEVYSVKMSKGAMIGYVFSESVPLIVREINTEVVNQLPSSQDCLGTTALSIAGFSDIFISNHLRNPSRSPIILYHIFLSF